MKKKIFPNDSALTNALFAVLMALLVAAVVLLNVLARGLSERYPLSADLTANAAYRIGDDTKAVLSDLSVDVDLYVLASEGSFSNNSYLTQLRHILEEYPRHSGHIRLSYVDVSADPTFAASYPDLEEIVSAGEYPVYWEVASSDAEEIVILFRSYTGYTPNEFRSRLRREG